MTRQISVLELRQFAQAVLDEVQIQDVRLASMRCTSAESILTGSLEVDSSVSFKGLQPSSRVVESAARYEITASLSDDTDGDESSRVAWELHFELRASFGARADGDLTAFDDDHLNAFALGVGLMHIHPFARETAQSMTGRLGYPPFTLEAMLPATAGDDDQLLDFGD